MTLYYIVHNRTTTVITAGTQYIVYTYTYIIYDTRNNYFAIIKEPIFQCLYRVS